ncbi:MAG: hypothetical protein ACC630_03105 [Nitrospinota bacterium]
MTYTRKAQVLLTEEEYRILEEVSAKTKKKLGTLIREAIEKVYVEEKKKSQIAESVDRLLSLPPTPAPEDYQEWEKEYSKLKGSCDIE